MEQTLDESAKAFAEGVAYNAYWNDLAQWSYTAWYAGFALGAALLILFVVLPRRTESVIVPAGPKRLLYALSSYRSAMLHGGGILLLVLCAVSSQSEVDHARGFLADQDRRYEAMLKKLGAKGDKEAARRAQYMYMPRGNSLIYVTAGNPALAADYIWLTSQQYVVNSFRRGQKFEMLLKFYDTLMELEPHWTEAAINAGKVLSALEQDRYAVEKFYIRAIVNNPGNHRLAYEAGRLFVVPPLNPQVRKDYSRRAAGWFQRVIDQLKTQPTVEGRERFISELQDLIARLSVESQSYEIADQLLLKNVKDAKNSRAMREISARDWLNARSLLMSSRIQERVDAFKAQKLHFPLELTPMFKAIRGDRLFRDFDENGIPLDAYGFPFRYDAVSGMVTSHGADLRRSIQSVVIVRNMIEMFQRENQSRNPATLQELQAWVRTHYANPQSSPTPAITDALGIDLNVIDSPFGKAWDYDAASGVITLPPESDAKILFKNADRLMDEFAPELQ